MSRTITFIRHAETTANLETRWQGRLDTKISPNGLDQVERLRARQNGAAPGRLISSDLGRAMQTAAAIGEPEPDPAWREFDVGGWEGLTTAEVQEQFPGQFEAMLAGEDVSLGGGERLSVFRERIVDAFWALVGSMDDGDRATVVTHGGVIWGITSDVLGFSRNAPLSPPHNTSLTHITVDDDNNRQVSVLNDATHLDAVPRQFGPAGKHVTVIRHAQTEGNLVHRWQGRSDSPLTDLGREQATIAAQHLPALDLLYTSPLGRTMQTSNILTEALGLDPIPHDGLVEMAFGEWENMTFHESREQDPDLFEQVYVNEVDLPRGRTGESYEQTGERMAAAIGEIVTGSNGSRLGAVSHGAAIRAYVSNIAGLDFRDRNLLALPRNTSMSSVVYTERVPVITSYNVAPHLD